MILLDTNVVSELMRAKPRRDANVSAFLNGQPLDSFFLPSIVVAELRYGILRLPAGRKRAGLQAVLEQLLAEGFTNRMLVFDGACATKYAEARSARERTGRPVAMADALIGGMALAYGARLATRNTGDFEGYGLSLMNPWDAQ